MINPMTKWDKWLIGLAIVATVGFLGFCMWISYMLSIPVS